MQPQLDPDCCLLEDRAVLDRPTKLAQSLFLHPSVLSSDHQLFHLHIWQNHKAREQMVAFLLAATKWQDNTFFRGVNSAFYIQYMKLEA